MPVKARIRFDFKAEPKGRRFFWQRCDLQETAKSLRAKKVSLLKSLPFQGVNVTDLDTHQEIYLIPNDANDQEVAYAPVELTVEAESLEDLMQLTLREEFRKIKVMEPAELRLSTADVERLLFRVTEEYREEILE